MCENRDTGEKKKERKKERRKERKNIVYIKKEITKENE